MRKNQNDNKILFTVIVVTIVILGIMLFNVVRKQLMERSAEQKQPSEETVFQPEATAEEGIFLEVTSPPNASTISNPNLQVSGKTEPGAEVFINESELKADSSGSFSVTITLEEGENIIVVTASDAEGNYAEKTLTVIYEPSE